MIENLTPEQEDVLLAAADKILAKRRAIAKEKEALQPVPGFWRRLWLGFKKIFSWQWYKEQWQAFKAYRFNENHLFVALALLGGLGYAWGLGTPSPQFVKTAETMGKIGMFNIVIVIFLWLFNTTDCDVNNEIFDTPQRKFVFVCLYVACIAVLVTFG